MPSPMNFSNIPCVLYASTMLLAGCLAFSGASASTQEHDFCKGEESRPYIPHDTDIEVAKRFPDDMQLINPHPMEEDVLDIEIRQAGAMAVGQVSAGGVLVVCGQRQPDHPEGPGIEVLGVIAIPPGSDLLELGGSLNESVPGFYQKGVILHFVPDPAERNRRSRLAKRVAEVAVGAGVGAMGGGTVAAGTALLSEQIFDDDEEESAFPLYIRASISPRPGTAPQEVGTVTHASEPAESEPETEQPTRTESITFDPGTADEEAELDPRLRRAQEQMGEGSPDLAGSPAQQPAPADPAEIAEQMKPEEDCVSFNPESIEAREVQGSWRIVDGSHWVMNFDDARDEAKQALAIIQHHGFDRLCFVGRPDPSMTYLLSSEAAPAEGVGMQPSAEEPTELPLTVTEFDSPLESAANRILWTFANDSKAPESFPASVEVSKIRDPNELSRFEVTDRYDYPNSPIFRFSPSERAVEPHEALETDAYVEFDITPTDGPVTLNRIVISMASGGSAGAQRGLHLRYNVDDYQSILWKHEAGTTRPDIERISAPLEGVTITGPTRFRLYATSSGSGRTLEIGDMAFDLQ